MMRARPAIAVAFAPARQPCLIGFPIRPNRGEEVNAPSPLGASMRGRKAASALWALRRSFRRMLSRICRDRERVGPRRI